MFKFFHLEMRPSQPFDELRSMNAYFWHFMESKTDATSIAKLLNPKQAGLFKIRPI